MSNPYRITSAQAQQKIQIASWVFLVLTDYIYPIFLYLTCTPAFSRVGRRSHFVLKRAICHMPLKYPGLGLGRSLALVFLRMQGAFELFRWVSTANPVGHRVIPVPYKKEQTWPPYSQSRRCPLIVHLFFEFQMDAFHSSTASQKCQYEEPSNVTKDQ